MANGKVTLAELRKESERVHVDAELCEYRVNDVHCMRLSYVEVSSNSRNKSRRRMLKLLRALPDGALKEG
jgi:hypothetical protein